MARFVNSLSGNGVSTSSRGFGRVITGSRFDGRRSASLHAQQRGVSPPYVYRGIHVGMRRETAVQAVEARLALAASLIDSSAFRTGLRGVGGRHLDQCSASLLQLVGKDGFECGPALIYNRPIKAALSGAGRRHVDDLQILHDDRPEPLCDAQRGPVVPVSTDAGSLGGKLSTTPELAQTALGPLLAAGENLLRSPMAPINRAKARRHGQMLAGRERQRVRHAAVNADAGQVVGRCLVLNLAGERNVPAERVKAHGCRLDRAHYGARITELYPSNFGQANSRPFGIEPIDRDLATLSAKTFIQTLPPQRRVVFLSFEEVAIRPIQIAQRLFLRDGRHRCDPIEFSTQLGQLAALRSKADVLAGLPQMLPPKVTALLKSEIVDQSAHASELAQRGFLFIGRGELVAESSVHAEILP